MSQVLLLDGPSLATSHGFNPTYFWKLLWWDHLFVLFSDNFINHGVILTNLCIHDRYPYMLPRVLCLVRKLSVYLICLPTEPLICIIYHYSSHITVVINSFSIQWIKRTLPLCHFFLRESPPHRGISYSMMLIVRLRLHDVRWVNYRGRVLLLRESNHACWYARLYNWGLWVSWC